ncbi:hypothetical protein PHO31112_05195 [Pandoraea horticolens]|uniref:Uncharacterized protein n=1 Tax=Pandoraea horticolens TaxID=2508298 RepID=A0A5E4ZBA8_9BURK|nr:hypothetical protein PHO31112_05195 [Pandoraea horticolens]
MDIETAVMPSALNGTISRFASTRISNDAFELLIVVDCLDGLSEPFQLASTAHEIIIFCK